MSQRPEILDQAALLSDPIRCRLLILLERQELRVSELCVALQLPQSTVSRHLKALADKAWIDSRRDGTRHFYAAAVGELPPPQRRLWMLLRDAVTGSASYTQDLQRLEQVLAERSRRSAEFFDSSAGHWDSVRHDLFGDRFDLLAMLAIADSSWVVGDLGCGTGRLSSRLAPFVARVIAVDSSAAMLQAAENQLSMHDNVELRRGTLEDLPLRDAEIDLALLVLTLHHVAEPRKVLQEACRVLQPQGALLLVDMQPHDRDSYQSEMGHVWLGFSDGQLRALFADVGLTDFEYLPLPVDLSRRGPALFVARARRSADSSNGNTDLE